MTEERKVTQFPGGGMRDDDSKKEAFQLLWTEAQPYEDQMLTRAALWMARGAEKYESRNWELFDSPEALEHAKASLLRHTFKLLAGETDEDHAAAVWFNSQVIEYVRWRFRKASAEILEEPKPSTSYWEGTTGRDIYYLKAVPGEDITFTTSSCQEPLAAYSDIDEMKADNWHSLVELPIDEVPEWAR